MLEDSGFDSDHKSNEMDQPSFEFNIPQDSRLSAFGAPVSNLGIMKESEISVNSLTHTTSVDYISQPLYVQSGLHKKLEKKLKSRLHCGDVHRNTRKDQPVSKLIPFDKLPTPNSSHSETQPLVIWNSDSDEESLQAFEFSPQKNQQELTGTFSIEDLTACDDFEDLDLSPPKPLSARYSCCNLVLEKPQCVLS